MKNLALFGASGGLGSQLIPYLEKTYNVIALSSKIVDITKQEKVIQFFNDADVDIVVNLSGTNYDSFVHKINPKNIDEIKKVIDVNIYGNINIVSSCLPKMREKNYGRIILISSILSIKPVVATAIYSGTKSFIDTFARITSAENISKGITCNSIQLGYFDGGMAHRIPEPYRENIKNSIALKRWGSIPELQSTIEYLINTEYVTGQNLIIDGGVK